MNLNLENRLFKMLMIWWPRNKTQPHKVYSGVL